jgi:hypothetical protein
MGVIRFATSDFLPTGASMAERRAFGAMMFARANAEGQRCGAKGARVTSFRVFPAADPGKQHWTIEAEPADAPADHDAWLNGGR